MYYYNTQAHNSYWITLFKFLREQYIYFAKMDKSHAFFNSFTICHRQIVLMLWNELKIQKRKETKKWRFDSNHVCATDYTSVRFRHEEHLSSPNAHRKKNSLWALSWINPKRRIFFVTSLSISSMFSSNSEAFTSELLKKLQ